MGWSMLRTMRKSESAERLWQIVLAVVVAFAIIAQLALLLTGGADANSGKIDPSLRLGETLVRFFSYFTIQSNLVVLVVSIMLAANPERDGKWWRVLRLDSLLGIVITGLVFALVLARIVHLTGLAYVVTICLHYISPPMTLLAWLLFGPRSRIGWPTVAWAFAWPALWIIYTFLHGAISGWYPYPFLNPLRIGYPSALGNTALVIGAAGILALVFKWLDDRLAMRGKRLSIAEKSGWASQTPE